MKLVNTPINKVFVDVECQEVSDDLARFIIDEREALQGRHHGLQPDDPACEQLATEYRELGDRVLMAVVFTFNRLVSYARNHKGQHWLRERSARLERLQSANVVYQSRVTVDGQEWFRWCPPSIDRFTVHVASDDTSIREEEWESIRLFVGGNSRPDLTLELLSNAYSLIDAALLRGAIVEAVSALETAIAAFSAAPALETPQGKDLCERMDLKSVETQVQKLGLRGTVKYLLPILFPKEVLSTELLRMCQKAVDTRNTVIHRGQRTVSEKRIRRLVGAVRQLCEVLGHHTNDRPGAAR